MTFNDLEILVVHTMVMRLTERESVAYLKSNGYDVSTATYYNYKAKIKGSAIKRKFELMREGLWEQHLERIDQLETILKLSWENFHREKEAFKKQRILDSIANIQPLLSAYYQASQNVLEYDKTKGILHNGYLSNISESDNTTGQ